MELAARPLEASEVATRPVAYVWAVLITAPVGVHRRIPVVRLVEQFDAAGLAVEVSIRGTDTARPDGVDLSAYRIVQEGLTNVLRHGGPKAWLTVDRQPGCVRLIGMRERVALFGGTLTAGPRAGGGLELMATLPYRDPS